jgi:dodecin
MAFVGEREMSVAKISEISSTSTKGFEDAIQKGIERASRTLEGITGAWVNEMKVDVTDGKITDYRVNLRVTFVLND